MFKKNMKKSSSDVINIDAQSHAMEQYKNIRANIEFLEADKKYKTILVTSCEAGAGKTTTSFHLAKAFALRDEKVILVGGDLRKPALNNFLDHDQKQSGGLVSAILKKSKLEDSIGKSKELDNLYFLYAGFIPPNPAELIQTESMKEIFEVLKDNFDRIIIDSPPMLPVVDTKLLSSYADGIILVVRANYTDKDALTKALSEIDNMKIKSLGMILNAVEVEKRDQYYYYYE